MPRVSCWFRLRAPGLGGRLWDEGVRERTGGAEMRGEVYVIDKDPGIMQNTGLPHKLQRGHALMVNTKPPYRLKTVVVALTFVSIGLLALVTSLQIHDQDSPVLKGLLREFATIAIIGATLHAIWELFQRQDYIQITNEKAEQILGSLEVGRGEIVQHMRTHEQQIVSRLDVANQARYMGLAEITRDARGYDYTMLLEESNLVAVLNDGRSWVSNNAPKLRKRFADPTKKTKILVIHPDSPMYQVIAKKEGTTVEAVRMKLDETLRVLATLTTPSTELEIFGHFLYNPHTIFLCDSFALVTPYFHSRTRRASPIFKYEDTSPTALYLEIRSDIDALDLDAVRINLPEPAPPMLHSKAPPSVVAPGK